MEYNELKHSFNALTTLIIDKAGVEGKIISPQEIAMAIGITMEQYMTYSHSDMVAEELIEKLKQSFAYFLRDIVFEKFEIDMEVPCEPRIPIQPWDEGE